MKSGSNRFSPPQVLDAGELERLREWIESLPTSVRQITVLRFGAELSEAEIATVMELSVETVRNQLSLLAQRIQREVGRSVSRPLGDGLLLQGLSAAICSGNAPPPQLFERVMERVACMEASAGRRSTRLRPTGLRSAGWFLCLILAIVSYNMTIYVNSEGDGGRRDSAATVARLLPGVAAGAAVQG